MSTLKFADVHNLVTFLSKPTKSEGFEQIVDFLNANAIKYALMVNLTVYTSCIDQFWATVKAKTVNGEVQLQALVDGKKVIITESTIRRDLQLENAKGVDCLPNAAIFEQLTLMRYEKILEKLTFYKEFFSPQWKFLIHTILKCISAKTTTWNEFSSTMASAIICLATSQKFNFSKYIFESMMKNLDNVNKFLMYPMFAQVILNNQLEGMSNHNRIYVTSSHTKNIFINMRRVGKDFSGRETPLFPTIMVQAQKEMGEGSANPTNLHHTPTIIQISTSQPQNTKQHRKPRRKVTEKKATTTATSLDAEQDRGNIFKTQSKATPNEPGSHGTSSGGGPRVLDLETTTTQALEIDNLKRRLKKLERRKRSRTHVLKRLYKVGLLARVKSLKMKVFVAQQKENVVEKEVDDAQIQVTTAATTPTISIEKVTLAQALVELKHTKPKAKAKGVVFHELEESTTTTTTTAIPKLISQDKGKVKMIKQPVKVKKKDQI
uniref:Synaptobrevin, longin-like domain protein n=1 Tax=Tanacetum cinerariifolium TaxID=118510 RepID=A0A699KL50_TANCI|nr:hypothetical protein [Tanacetum cinerariifolium]